MGVIYRATCEEPFQDQRFGRYMIPSLSAIHSADRTVLVKAAENWRISADFAFVPVVGTEETY
jgi:hypothetical protein